MANDKVWEDPDGDIRVDFSGQSKTAKNIGNKAGLTEYAGIDLASGFPKDQIWITKDNRRIAIPNMSDQHLLNTIAFLRRRVDNYKKQLAMSRLHGLSQTINMFDMVNDDWIDEAYDRFRKAAKDLFDMPDEEFLNKYFVQYGHLYREAYRRKILIEVDSRKIVGPASEKTTRKVKVPKSVQTDDELAEEWANGARETDGVEVPRGAWEIAELVVKKYPTEFGLGGARGPNSNWKRLYLIDGDGDT